MKINAANVHCARGFMIKALFIIANFLLMTVTVQAEECLQPDKLVFSVVPSDKKSLEIENYQPLANAIAQQLNISVELKALHSYGDIVSELIQGELHFARLGAFSYVTAASLNDSIQPFAVHYHASNPPFQDEGSFYYSILIVHADSPYKDIASLQNKTVLLTEQGSTSGVLVPRVLFTKHMKVAKLNDFFDAVIYSGGHDTSTLAIANREFDAAFVSARNLSRLVMSGAVDVNQFRILWRSQPIPHGPYVFNNHLCEPYQNVIAQAAFNIHKSIEGQTMLQALGALCLAPVTAGDYSIVQELSKLRH
ncbi:phosphate/phosphite/phosphonate ABC transporter substrate-binding protein [Candidatus Albibeggiatoa sp. nov. NOAA]|uniref:phosphate/phosphite/phosphonate ABC transporter substrate-binding protein n=1 Tax=Candidatus Albibeggiatoa sp. nov. NOAA TaxID=3162724 RepID=UPI0032FE3719|nr:phosphate/phosphite/phosphonate ABC transporter substrate-binding protein [Thiotrichaceae bacterium]